MSIKRNVIANYIGQGWSALMGLAFIPLYIQYIGIEAYGLIGIFTLLQTWFSILDMGMAPTLSREMARFIGGMHTPQTIRDLLRSIEIIICLIAILVMLIVWAISDWLASEWITTKLSISTVAQVFAIMGLIIAMRFFETIYRSAIIGLQKQILLNIISSISVTFKWAGAFGVLAWISPSIKLFFLWQGFISFLTLLSYMLVIYLSLPKTGRSGKFSIAEIKNISNFAGGMTVITFLSLLLTQIDKVILSNLLSLEDFGYYSLSAVIAGILYTLAQPITQAYFPRFSELIAKNKKDELIHSYHKSAQLFTVIIGSVAIALIFCTEPILIIWSNNTDLVQHTKTLIIILSIGNLFNGLMMIPYQMQIAHGKTDYIIIMNIISVLIIVPAILLITPKYGAKGAASIWVMLNIGYILIGAHFIKLYHEKWRWYFFDIILPLSLSFLIIFLISNFFPSKESIIDNILWLFITITTTISVSFFLTSKLSRSFLFYKKTPY